MTEVLWPGKDDADRSEGAFDHLLVGMAHTHVPQLTAKLVEIMQHAADGLTIDETAIALNKAPSTVNTQRRKAYKALGARNVQDAIAIAIRTGVID